jgi:hypothetical protein
MRGLHHGIGGEDGPGRVFKAIRRETRDQTRHRVHDQMRVQLHANHARGSGKNLRRRNVQTIGHGIATSQRDAIAGLGGAIGIARIDQHRAHQSARFGQIPARDANRRGLHAILREHGSARGRRLRNDQRQIVLLHFADSGVHGRISIAQR